MKRLDIFHKLAELLNLPVELIHAFAKPRGRIYVAAKRVRPPKAEKIEYPRDRENELYAQWFAASSPEQKNHLEFVLFEVLNGHAEAVMKMKLGEIDPDLAVDIASAGIEGLSKFRGEAKFSTWMHRIALNKVNMELRNRVTTRKRYYSSRNPEEDELLKDAKAAGAFDELEQRILLARLQKELSAEEYVLFECLKDDKSTAETAEKLGISEDAAESRRRRLIKKLQQKFAKPRRKVTTSSN